MSDPKELLDFSPELKPGCMVGLMTGSQILILDSYEQALQKLNDSGSHELVEFDCFTTMGQGDLYNGDEKEPFRLTVNSAAVVEVKEITDHIYTRQREISNKEQEELERKKESGEVVEFHGEGMPAGLATILGRFGLQPPNDGESGDNPPTGEE